MIEVPHPIQGSIDDDGKQYKCSCPATTILTIEHVLLPSYLLLSP